MFGFLSKEVKKASNEKEVVHPHSKKEVVHLGLRVFNQSRNSIMLYRYKKTKVWTIPNIEVSNLNFDIEHCLDKIVSIINPHSSFELIGALPIIRYEDEQQIWSEPDKKHIQIISKSYIYEMQYNGIIYQDLSYASLNDQFSEFVWVSPFVLASMTPSNRITEILTLMMEKEKCLS